VHDTEVSTSRATPLTSVIALSELERGMHRVGMPKGLLDEARAERTPWQEFRAHGASLNIALTKAVWLHGGRSFQNFEVRVFVRLAPFSRFLSHPGVFRSHFFFRFLIRYP
jgi:hypothetical protein